MKSSTRNIFFIAAAIAGTYLWFTEASELTRNLWLIGFLVLYFYYDVLGRLSVLQSKQDVIIDMLWQVSSKVGIEDGDLEHVGERLRQIRKSSE